MTSGTVTVSGDARLPAGGSLFVGTPEGRKWRRAPSVQQCGQGDRHLDQARSPTASPTTSRSISRRPARPRVIVPISAGLAAAARARRAPRRVVIRRAVILARYGHRRGERAYRSTAARNAVMSPPNGWAAAWSAAPGAPSTRWPCSARSAATAGGRHRPASQAVPISSVDAQRRPALLHRRRRTRPGARRRCGARLGDAAGRRSRRG